MRSRRQSTERADGAWHHVSDDEDLKWLVGTIEQAGFELVLLPWLCRPRNVLLGGGFLNSGENCFTGATPLCSAEKCI